MLKNTFLNEFQIGTKILFEYCDNNEVIVKEEVATISSINHYNNNLYEATFKEKQGTYALTMDQFGEMKKAYERSKK